MRTTVVGTSVTPPEMMKASTSELTEYNLVTWLVGYRSRRPERLYVEGHVHGHVVGESEAFQGILRDEAERLGGPTTVGRDHDGRIEAPMLADERVEEVLGRRIEEPHEREPLDRAVDRREGARGEEGRAEEPDEGEQRDRDNEAEAWDRQAHPAIDGREDAEADVDRDREGRAERQAAEKVRSKPPHVG